MAKLPIELKLLLSLFKKGKKIRLDQEILSLSSLIRLVRLGLEMTQSQLASRAKIPRSTIYRIEKGMTGPNEETLKKIFSALECDLAFIPIPRFESIESLLRKRARRLAKKRLHYIEGTMALEQQRPQKKWGDRLLEAEIESILKSPNQLWDDNAE